MAEQETQDWHATTLKVVTPSYTVSSMSPCGCNIPGGRVYIAGPMGSNEDKNRTAFDLAEKFLKKMGFDPVNPHKINEGLDPINDRQSRIINDITALIRCTHIFMLPNWKESPGARHEWDIACWLNLNWVLTHFRFDPVTQEKQYMPSCVQLDESTIAIKNMGDEAHKLVVGSFFY